MIIGLTGNRYFIINEHKSVSENSLEMKKTFALLLILISTYAFTACEFGDDIDVGNAYNFKVISAKGSFTGYYIENGGKMNIFNSETLDGTYHSFEKNLSSPESVYISATGSDSGTTSISILVFADNKLVSDKTVNQIDSEVITAILHHTFTK